MTTPQPNQLPEEVKRAIHDALFKPGSSDSLGSFIPYSLHEVEEHICAALTPYLAPRPPAPVNVEWALHAVHDIQTLTRLWVEAGEEEKAAAIILRHAPADSASAQLMRDALCRVYELINGSDDFDADEVNKIIKQATGPYAISKEWCVTAAEKEDKIGGFRITPEGLKMNGANKTESDLAAMTDAFGKLREQVVTAEADNATLRHEVKVNVENGLQLHAQLSAAQSEVGRLTGEATCHFMDIEAAIGKGRLLGGWRTATSEIATLRRERDELRADKERLDWLQRHVIWCSGAENGIRVSGRLTNNPCVREFLDAARAKQGEGQPEDAKEGRK